MEELRSLAEEYEMNYNRVKKYWNIIRNIPEVMDTPEEDQLSCLEILLSDRITADVKGYRTSNSDNCIEPRTLKESIAYALSQTYGMDNDVLEDSDFDDEFDEVLSDYNGYSRVRE